MSDLISRQAAICALEKCHKKCCREDTVGDEWIHYETTLNEIESLPSAEPERKTGRWILVKGSDGKDYHKCSHCLHTQDIVGVKNYCAVCGADMMNEADMRDGKDEEHGID